MYIQYYTTLLFICVLFKSFGGYLFEAIYFPLQFSRALCWMYPCYILLLRPPLTTTTKVYSRTLWRGIGVDLYDQYSKATWL